MTVHIYLAPAASGKTTYILEQARSASKDLLSESLILVPSAAHRYDLQRRLAEMGGAIGVRIDTFSNFSQDILKKSGGTYQTIDKAVQIQLLRHVVNRQELQHFQPIASKPGFIQETARVIHELKAAKIWPDEFTRSVREKGGAPRLLELGAIYREYQAELNRLKWADSSGWAWLAVEALEDLKKEDAKSLFGYTFLAVDGFDSFTEVLLAMLVQLKLLVDETIITITQESAEPGTTRDPFKQFQVTKEELEKRLDVIAEPLPVGAFLVGARQPAHSGALDHLEKNLFSDGAPTINGGDAITLIACPDRAAEVRAALRWLKERIVVDGLAANEVALLARGLDPYLPYIRQTASEFKLPVHLSTPLPLKTNPAIVAIMNLLALHLPASDEELTPVLPRQGVVDAWRSPYFDWSRMQIFPGQIEQSAITPADADKLDAYARDGRVISGQDQWEEVLPLRRYEELLKTLDGDSPLQLEPLDLLSAKFHGFCQLIKPPASLQTYRDFAAWLDTLLGENPNSTQDQRKSGSHLCLQLKNTGTDNDDALGDDNNENADAEDVGDDPIFQRDKEALKIFKEILRSIDWVEEAIGEHKPITYRQFYVDLLGMIETTTYAPPEWLGAGKIMAADVIQSRGLAFRAVALLGLAEGEFPKTYTEDPFLWESDRSQLGPGDKALLESSIESYEREYFYQAVTRGRDKLLLTRPRLADSGAEWQPSPFWEEIQRLFDVQPIPLTTESLPDLDQAASLSELVESLLVQPDCPPALAHLETDSPGRMQTLYESTGNFELRFARAKTPLNGDLTGRSDLFRVRFDASYVWSASSLENYHSCPYYFFVGRALGLQVREEPAVGMDAAQRGTIYHQIFEQLYQTADLHERTDPNRLLQLLPAIARRILDAAPEERKFRETAWWRESREEIENSVARSIIALAAVQEDFVPVDFELHFSGSTALTVRDGQDQFILTGYIDRLDRDGAGNSRIIDYKTSGSSGYGKNTFESGERIQLALYALAARDAFGKGEPVDGFYWHVFEAKPSPLTLKDYGPAEAIDLAVNHAWNSVRGARQGDFVARPPSLGCPDYCPAVAFCWNYRPKSRN